ncbi:unnamed protein product [Dracunculus medinensis]|uniref:Uncharacterized protein n=1 Tax=Dracunculus medinensis TaxID=318479 RepID=A0A0N4U0H9_DRAME|nr:unnamed protein product [Dracunculus medinensis]
MLLFINSLPVEEVLDFKYLGSTLIPNGQAKNDISTRISRITVARNAFFRLTKSLWSRREITIKTKVRDLYGRYSLDVALRSNTTCINEVIIERHLWWLGHVFRCQPQELSHISLLAKPCNRWRQKRANQDLDWYGQKRLDGPAIYGLKRWKKERLLLLSTMVSGRAACKFLTLVASGTSLTSNGKRC